MTNHVPKKTGLKTKLAVALAAVNALNAAAPMVLPYVNVTRTMSTEGGQAQPLADVARAFYGTAEARTTSTITSGHSQTYINMNDGDIIIEGGGQTTGTTLGGSETTSGVEIIKYNETSKGGIAKKTTINAGGTQIVSSGGISVNTKIHGGVLVLHSGALLKNTGSDDDSSTDAITSNNANTYSDLDLTATNFTSGTLVLMDGALKSNTELSNNCTEIVSGGTSIDTVVNGGTQIVKAGTATGATLSGGVQEISGGTVTGTTVNGGTQHISGGAMASGTVLNGGTVSVEDNATAQIATATGGTLELLETGLAEAVFGGLAADTFTVDTLTATGDTVRLGLGGNGGTTASTVGKTLNITNLIGSAKFYVNTDLANSKSDKINITNSTQDQSTILVNYDPTIAAGQSVAGTKALVATVGDNNATFVGGETTIGGYTFTPTLVQEGTNWFITGAENTGSSEQMYAALSNSTWKALAWRDSNFAISGRMAQLHHDPTTAHQNDFWVDFTRGRMRTNTFGHGVNRTYDRVSVGYDRLVGHGWTVGLAYGYEKGSEGYGHGSGDSTGNVVTAYAAWQGARGNYLDMTVKGGQLESDFTVQDESQLTPSQGKTRATGAGVSAVYGHRFENASAFYVEPHAGLYWSHLGGYDYRLSDGSDVSVDGCNSFVGNLGVNVGQRLGKGEVYARADFMHDFSGNIRVSMTKSGTNNTMENPLRDSWFNVALGYRQNYERVGWYAEAGCQGIGSRESSGDWVWKAGVEFKF